MQATVANAAVVIVEPSSPIQKVWKPELYKIQLEAPTPKPLKCTRALSATEITGGAVPVPACYGTEYHGVMGHLEAEQLLGNAIDGTYLLRRSPNAYDYFTLSVRFNKRTKHFKIYYKHDKGHYLQEQYKHYDSVHEMVADGLINFHMQLHAAPIIQQINQQTKNCYQQSPYMTLNRRKLRALSNELRKSIDNKVALTQQRITAAATTTTKTTLVTTGSLNTCDGTVSNNKININGYKTEAPTIQSNNNNNSNSNKQNQLNSFAQRLKDTTECDPILPLIYEKLHNFKVHTFKGLNWCEFCANFLWGFTAQGVKCDACGFVAHSKCSELVPPKCVPDLKRIRGVFGTDLTTMVQLHQCSIPFVVRRCVEEVEARGMLQEGIYRVSGFADEIDALKLALDRDGEKTDMSEAAYGNINVIAGTLKLYLRLLPVPLITFHAYPSFMAASRNTSNTDEQLQQMSAAVRKLPLAHYNCLKYMLEHLKRVASHYAANKMNEHNLATVFAPTLIATPQHMTNLTEEIFMLSSLITNCKIIFNTNNICSNSNK